MSETKDWRKICAACQEGEPPEDCEYYGEPNGCNSPKYGKHPTCDKSSQVGNAAKMRKALVEIYNEIRSYCIDYGAGESHKSLLDRIVDDPPDYTSYRDSILKIDRIAESALSAPPRNCDVYTKTQLCEMVTEEIKSEFGTDIPQGIIDIVDIVAKGMIRGLFAEAKGEQK